MEMVARAAFIGIGATILIDLWALFLRTVGVPAANYAMIGRWLGHIPAGRFTHPNIAAAPGIRGERVIGWAAHYAIGIVFAVLLLALCGEGWARQPTPVPALAFGIFTVAAPFFIMQPGMGFGVAASRTPKPNIARLRSVATHTVFGLGLYASAWFQAQFPS